MLKELDTFISLTLVFWDALAPLLISFIMSVSFIDLHGRDASIQAFETRTEQWSNASANYYIVGGRMVSLSQAEVSSINPQGMLVS